MERAIRGQLPVELTELQKQILQKRLAALQADFPVKALRILMKDGSDWLVGEFPEVKKKRTRKLLEGAVHGELVKAIRPWVELAASEPETPVKVRPSDFPGIAFERLPGAASALGIGLLGKGNFSVNVVEDVAEGKALVLTAKSSKLKLGYE